MKITLEASQWRSVLGLGDGDEQFPEFIARRIRLAELARALVNHAVTIQAVAEALPLEAGKTLTENTAQSLSAFFDDCGNGRFPRLVLIPIPFPWPPIPEPHPNWKLSLADRLVLGLELAAGMGAITNRALLAAFEQGSQAFINGPGKLDLPG